MAHGEAKVGFHDIGNLLRAVIVLYQVKDYSPLGLGKIGTTPCSLAASYSLAMGNYRSVVTRGWS